MGRYCVVDECAVLRPQAKRSSKSGYGYFPLTVGDYVYIGKNCIVEASSVGSHVVVGDNCVLGKWSTLRDCVRVLPNSVLPGDIVVPPFSVVGGNPAVVVGTLNRCFLCACRFA
eukprot:NODE_1225_length_1228_cov_162.723494_g998_i0.p2 GENE.NODE_1225_length_1228_cov_162.723494_g998_i0~~NODE_1225_length_1228_cov_162.723494_g998_i0.p2  ORF type:complete len:114 (+),score=20.50 NODE_1225_length_1228_cov_162.723494_g998_i0:704-1045(+)